MSRTLCVLVSMSSRGESSRCGHEDGRAAAAFDEDAVGYEDVKVRVEVEGRAAALHESDRAAARVVVAIFASPTPIPTVDHPQEDRQHGAEEVAVPSQPEPDLVA
ncbi:MAG: hypothetical protein WD423_05895 [Rhodothermales bacterium]